MDNIWADSFSEIREYSLQEKKQEKKEGKPKRWWDDDGDGVGYEPGEVSGKFKKTKKEGKDYDPMEDPEFDHDEAEKNRGVSGKNNPKGGKKLKKEETEVDEAFPNVKGTLNPWEDPKTGKSRVKLVTDPKTGKPKEISKEEVEIEEGLKKARKNVGASKCWDGYKARGTKMKGGKEVPDCQKEERELSSKKDNGEMIDVMKGKNKIEINPKLGEEIQAWVGELLDEGYDLSKFTPDEIVEIYESAEEEQGNSQMSAVKQAAVRSQVRRDRDRLRLSQMQQRTKTSPMESVLNFVESRELPNFEV